jgi:starch synthase (maltosyl-transferring)
LNIQDGRQRVVIERVSPEIDGGRFPIKRVPGESVEIEADIFADGHDTLSAVVKFRHAAEAGWPEAPMQLIENDRWRGSFAVEKLGNYFYTIEAWVDRFETWRRDLEKKVQTGMDVAVELLAGAELLREAARRAGRREGDELNAAADALSGSLNRSRPPPSSSIQGGDVEDEDEKEDEDDLRHKISIALGSGLAELMSANAARNHVTRYEKELRVLVDPLRARFGAWYEMFPRSCAREPGRHGTFKDCEALLPRIAELGFDILYLAPIHPIGRSFRKGRNNRLRAEPDEPGSPWAIGSEAGGHKSIHAELGTLEDFRRLVARAKKFQIEIALDIAFQCSPDHPYVREHPEWFRKRPGGSIQYAENPPKKYQDIYPMNFETENWRELWVELKSVFEFWIEQGVRIFRVDNPHTKPFLFWEWCIGDLKARWPDLILLSEAFTRPKVMYHLAKLGFTQSYNYFPWRNTKHELTSYFTELTQDGVREYFRPSLWANTPDILTQYLQYGGRPAFMIRLILAATLGASYGIYGPAFELCENQPREPGSEEYLHSEKYEIRHWDLEAPGNLSELTARVNRIRRDNPALHSNESLRFHNVDTEALIAYSKRTLDGDNIILTVVNLDPYHVQRGWVSFSPETWGIGPTDSYQVHDLITDARYLWSGARNYVELNPHLVPAHVFRVRRYVRTERDFGYFM